MALPADEARHGVYMPHRMVVISFEPSNFAAHATSPVIGLRVGRADHSAYKLVVDGTGLAHGMRALAMPTAVELGFREILMTFATQACHISLP